jgi:hypothetical protein
LFRQSSAFPNGLKTEQSSPPGFDSGMGNQSGFPK